MKVCCFFVFSLWLWFFLLAFFWRGGGAGLVDLFVNGLGDGVFGVAGR